MPKTADTEPRLSQTDPEDFRVRAAREKREKMRRRLLDATLLVCSRETYRKPAMIDDVLEEAEVSRGTVYNYFSSLEEAIDELGRELMVEMVTHVAEVLQRLPQPAQRAVAGPLMYLKHAAQDPQWGLFVLRFDHLSELNSKSLIRYSVARDLLVAQKAGVLNFPLLEPALDLLVGSCRQAVLRFVSGGRRDHDYIQSLLVMNMVALGMSKRSAQSAVKSTWEQLQAMPRAGAQGQP